MTNTAAIARRDAIARFHTAQREGDRAAAIRARADLVASIGDVKDREGAADSLLTSPLLAEI